MLNTTNYQRIIWNRDAYTIPSGTNLYGDHPIYYDHRGKQGTHAVFLLNSNGHNVFINNDNGQYLEYDLLGGVLDFYFLAGPSPVEVSQQYSEIVGKSAMFPYWSLGFHQCRYGMQDVYEVAEVVANYSTADIPLETMWTDIDYMDLRKVFTLDPARFPLHLVQQLVDTIHARQQHYIMMVDPAVAYQDYPPFNNGVAKDAFMKVANGSVYKGVVWPGVTSFPDWFSPGTQDYWNGEFDSFFNANTGVDIDALWIDMNEASNFCDYPCNNPEAQAQEMGDPPRPPAIRLGPDSAVPGFPQDFQPQPKSVETFNVNASTFYGENILIIGSALTLGEWDITNAAEMSAANYPIWSIAIDLPPNTKVTYQYVRSEPDGTFVYEKKNRTMTSGKVNTYHTINDEITTVSPPHASKLRRFASYAGEPTMSEIEERGETGLSGRNLINPPYNIHDAAGSLSNKTLNTNLVHSNGLVEYDTHNMYGALMSETSRNAMLSRRPTVRPLVITRSTFAGSGGHVGKWFGDNGADWEHYLISIAELLEFGALYQMPMVGSDVCGYAGDTNVALCARWAMLGAFSPFYRNHGEDGSIPHEFYRWPLVAEAARNAITIRYQLLDYLYTAMYIQNQTGTPLVQPMFFAYPYDPKCNPLQYQYLYGPGLLVAPVINENSTSSSVYLPHDIFYDYHTHEKIQGKGATESLTDVAYTSIPLYYKGGHIFAQRAKSANTTTELRNQDFTIVIAPGVNGNAQGDLYLDDGDSLVQPSYSLIHFTYEGSSKKFAMSGHFGYESNVHITSIVVLGQQSGAHKNGGEGGGSTKIPLTGAYSGTA